jgi:DNA-binding MarR family transcriptional regulator
MYTQKDIRALARIANEFRVIEEDFPVSYIAVLAYIARHEVATGDLPNNAEVADNVGIARPTLSRIVRSLSDSRLGSTKPGEDRPEGSRPSLKLVEKLDDPVDHRMNRLRLTPKGRALLVRIADVFASYNNER